MARPNSGTTRGKPKTPPRAQTAEERWKQQRRDAMLEGAERRKLHMKGRLKPGTK